MAPKIKVPADFGIEHINSPVHGNLVLKLRDGQEIKTNSMIMSLNSPVIDNLTTNLTQSSLEMDDFTKEAVDCFVESLYTGEVESLKKQIFEDVNKMAHVFEVSWLTKRCLKFYKSDVLNYKSNSYEEVLFACEIASRAHYNLKQSCYVRCFVEHFSLNFSTAIFLQRYLADFADCSRRQIDMSVAVSRKSFNLMIMPLISHLSINLKCKSLDENSLYLLEKIDSQNLLKEHPILFKDTSSLLLEILEKSDSIEVKQVINNFVQPTTSSRSENSVVEMQFECDEESSGDEEFIEVASQTDVEPELILAKVVSIQEYPLLPGDSVQLITVHNEVESPSMFIYFNFAHEERRRVETYFAIKSHRPERWSYIVLNCTEDHFNTRFLKNVPNDKVKQWFITKTSTHLTVNCNEVTVLNFNFSADCHDNKEDGAKLWLKKPGSFFKLVHYNWENAPYVMTKKI